MSDDLVTIHGEHDYVNVNDTFIQRRVTKHLYCAVCAEWQRRNRFVFSDWSCCWWAASHGDCPVASSRPSDQRQRRSDDRKCWAGNVLRSGDVEWLTVNDVLSQIHYDLNMTATCLHLANTRFTSRLPDSGSTLGWYITGRNTTDCHTSKHNNNHKMILYLQTMPM